MSIIASSKTIIIVGLGVTGLSAARFLKKNNQPFLIMDSREAPPGLTEFKKEFSGQTIILGGLDQELLSHADEIVVSPGLSLKTPEIAEAIRQGVSVVGDVELFARENNKPIIAITGSNAKTTVTTLVGQMVADAGLNVAVGGNIGSPILDLIDDDVDVYVLELSSFQLETTHSLNATVATILNISEDHMDRYADLAEYHRAKQRIYFGAKTIVVNREDPLTNPPLAQNVRCISFGLYKPDRFGFGVIERNQKRQLAFEFKALIEAKRMGLRGEHNLANCLAALALGFAIKLPMESMLQTLIRFQGLPHRCQLVATIENVEYINDSKATNVGAALAALKGFSDKEKNIVLIAGGEGKDADFSPLRKVVFDCVRAVILIGRDAPLIAKVLDGFEAIHYVETIDDAVTIAKDIALPGNIVLLSPACASFDMFTGYEDRGEKFIKAVEKVAA